MRLGGREIHFMGKGGGSQFRGHDIHICQRSMSFARRRTPQHTCEQYAHSSLWQISNELENLGQFSDLEKGGHRNSSEDGEGGLLYQGKESVGRRSMRLFQVRTKSLLHQVWVVINIWDEGKDFEAWALIAECKWKICVCNTEEESEL